MRSLACICSMRPMRSVLPLTLLRTAVPVFRVPEYTRAKVSVPVITHIHIQ